MAKQTFEVWKVSDGMYALTIFNNARLMGVVNRALDYYYPYNETFKAFAQTDEPVFKFSRDKLQRIVDGASELAPAFKALGLYP